MPSEQSEEDEEEAEADDKGEQKDISVHTFLHLIQWKIKKNNATRR